MSSRPPSPPHTHTLLGASLQDPREEAKSLGAIRAGAPGILIRLGSCLRVGLFGYDYAIPSPHRPDALTLNPVLKWCLPWSP